MAYIVRSQLRLGAMFSLLVYLMDSPSTLSHSHQQFDLKFFSWIMLWVFIVVV